MPVAKTPTASFSPYYGCVIMLAAALIFGGIIGWSAYTLFGQNKIFAELAQDEPGPIAPLQLEPAEETQLQEKLMRFANDTKGTERAEVSLSLEELNALLALAPDLGAGSYGEMLRFTSLDPDSNVLHADLSFPVRKLPWEEGFRYLVGKATFAFKDTEAGFEATMSDISIPGKEIPEGFRDGMAFWPWIDPYRKTDSIGPVLKTIHTVKVTSTGLLLSTQKPSS
jgi:hypothetical protein